MTTWAPGLAEFDLRLTEVSRQQDLALGLVLPNMGVAFKKARLCGGTALSRFHLRHRLSYDLDFFLPMGFDAQALLKLLGRTVEMRNVEITHDAVKADQLHFTVDVDGMPIRISALEDLYADLSPAIPSGLKVANRSIMTEAIDGLYHRKLRTVVGRADAGSDQTAGGRQTARDMFDLFVLSQAHMPLRPFIEELPYAFSLLAFENGLANMPWFDLVGELEETITSPKWQEGKNVERLRQHLFAELGMTELPGAEGDDDNPSDAVPAARRKRP